MEFLPQFVLGIILGGVMTLLSIYLFPKLGLLDFPERYGLKRHRLPYPGGLVFFVLALGFFMQDFDFLPITVLIFWLGGLSFMDDFKNLSPFFRLFMHLVIAFFVFMAGIRIDFIGNPFVSGSSFDLTSVPILSLFLTVAWIVVIQNAMNWFDGIQGLSVGVSGVGFLTLGIFGLVRQEVAWEAGLNEFLLASFYFAGICVGAFFLFWRGKIILGDTGSQLLGFLLAILSISAGTKIATTLLVLGLPILDSIFVVFRRLILEHKSPFKGDKKHLHHNLSRKIGEKETAIFLILISGILGVIAVFFTGLSKLFLLSIVIAFVLFLNLWAGRGTINN